MAACSSRATRSRVCGGRRRRKSARARWTSGNKPKPQRRRRRVEAPHHPPSGSACLLPHEHARAAGALPGATHGEAKGCAETCDRAGASSTTILRGARGGARRGERLHGEPKEHTTEVAGRRSARRAQGGGRGGARRGAADALSAVAASPARAAARQQRATLTSELHERRWISRASPTRRLAQRGDAPRSRRSAVDCEHIERRRPTPSTRSTACRSRPTRRRRRRRPSRHRTPRPSTPTPSGRRVATAPGGRARRRGGGALRSRRSTWLRAVARAALSLRHPEVRGVQLY